MLPDKTHWNSPLVEAVFPHEISRLILNIPIHDWEGDSFVWVPTKTGAFSVRSSYIANNESRFGSLSNMEKGRWTSLWLSDLHERHKFLLWKILNDVIPTKARIHQFVPLPDVSCFLCGGCFETVHHLLFECPASVICWWNSPWNIRIQQYAGLIIADWFDKLLCHTSNIQQHLDEADKGQLPHFAIIVFEQLWMIRNRVRLGGLLPNWSDVSQLVNKTLTRYWQAVEGRRAHRKHLPVTHHWRPPRLGEFKSNTDVAFSNLHAVSGMILRDHSGTVVGAWSNHYLSPNVFCAEMEVVIQALRKAQELNLEKVHFESDSLEVVLALKGLKAFEDWQACCNTEER